MISPERDLGREIADISRQIVVFMGPEGSGKTTIARRLATETNLPYVTTGDILRNMAVNDQTEYGDECRAMFKEKRYLNPQMLLDILAKRFAQNDLKNGFINDGGLRIVEEVTGFQSVLERSDKVMPVTVIFLRVPGWMCMERLTTGKDARKRDDDTVEGVFSRLSHFYHDLGKRASLIERQPNWRLLHINGIGTPEETYSRVLIALT